MQRKVGQGRRRERRLSTRSGRLGVVLASVIGLGLAAVVLALWQLSEVGRPQTPSEAVAPVHEPQGSALEAALENPNARQATEASQSSPAPPPSYPSRLKDPARYLGTARVELYLDCAAGLPPPKQWTLSLEPSKVLLGSAHAKSRRVEVTDGSAALVLTDVALGAYEMRVLADGLESSREQVELHAPEENDVVVRIALYPQGALEGRIEDVSGQALDDIEVVLESRADRARRTTRSTLDGSYRFGPIPDGEYRVFVGAAEAPLASFDDVSFSAPSLHMPKLVVPRMGELRLLALDATATPIEGVTIEGLGLPSGPIKLVTGADGRARAPHCAAGELQLFASTVSGSRGALRVRFAPGETEELTISVGP